MNTLLLILQFVLAIILTIVVLLQKSSSIGLGTYSGSNESLFGAKGPAGFLAKFTFVLGILFIANTLFLGYNYNKAANSSVINIIGNKALQTIEKNVTIPTAPIVPKSPNTK